MNTSNNEGNEWNSREDGYMARIGQKARGSQRKRAVGRLTVRTLIVVGAVLIGLKMVDRSSPPEQRDSRAIACAEVQENLPAFIGGNLDAHLRADIEAHLEECPDCRAALAKLQASQARTSRRATLSRGKTLNASGKSNLLFAQH